MQAIDSGQRVGRDLDGDFEMSVEEFNSVLEDSSHARAPRSAKESKKQKVASPSINAEGGDDPDL